MFVALKQIPQNPSFCGGFYFDPAKTHQQNNSPQWFPAEWCFCWEWDSFSWNIVVKDIINKLKTCFFCVFFIKKVHIHFYILRCGFVDIPDFLGPGGHRCQTVPPSARWINHSLNPSTTWAWLPQLYVVRTGVGMDVFVFFWSPILFSTGNKFPKKLCLIMLGNRGCFFLVVQEGDSDFEKIFKLSGAGPSFSQRWGAQVTFWPFPANTRGRFFHWDQRSCSREISSGDGSVFVWKEMMRDERKCHQVTASKRTT